jgi:hypothetical protein
MSNQLQIGQAMPADKNVSTGYRQIRTGLEYNRYFPKPDSRDRVIIEDGEVTETLELMKKVVWKYLSDTKKIAPVLSGKTIEETCHSIWQFLYHHIQYRLDKKGVEQLRRPARSWQEREEGIDCDCFSIFASSILTNLGIPHSFRITKYGRDVFQHVYVIVPTSSGNYIIDPVLSKANYEKPYTEKKDFPMSIDGINIAVLSGTVENDLTDVVMATDLEGIGLGDLEEKQELDALYRHLVSTRNAVAQNPEMISQVDDATAFLKMLDYAIAHWNTPNREKALEILAENENKLNLQNGISGLDDELDDEEELLGRLFKRRKKKGKRRGFFTGIKKAVKGVGKGLKKIGKAIIRFNPISIAARNGFLIALKLNFKKMASKLKWAYATQQQASKKGISEQRWKQSKEALEKVESIFADKLQGKRKALRKAILNGKAGNLSGVIEDSGELSGLGEPVTAAAAATMIATASPIIIAVMKVLKKTGLMDKSEAEDVNISQEDIKAAATKSTSQFPTEEDSFPEGSDFNRSNSNSDNNSKQGNKAVRFLKNNPMVAVGGLAAIGGIGYLLFNGKKKQTTSNSLKGAPKRSSPRKQRVKTIRLS